jgi:hypothetical protein
MAAGIPYLMKADTVGSSSSSPSVANVKSSSGVVVVAGFCVLGSDVVDFIIVVVVVVVVASVVEFSGLTASVVVIVVDILGFTASVVASVVALVVDISELTASVVASVVDISGLTASVVNVVDSDVTTTTTFLFDSVADSFLFKFSSLNCKISSVVKFVSKLIESLVGSASIAGNFVAICLPFVLMSDDVRIKTSIECLWKFN